MGTVNQHAEAFCVMTYRCGECGHDHFFWNSRDGVTPFMTQHLCNVCLATRPMTHVNFKNDTPCEKPPEVVDGVFIDLSHETAHKLTVDRIAAFVAQHGHDPSGALEDHVNELYGDGKRPYLISIEEWKKREQS